MDGETPSSLLISSEVSDEANRDALKLSPVPDNDVDVTPTIKNHKKTVRFNNEIETIQDEKNITEDSEQMLDNTIIGTNRDLGPTGYATMALDYAPSLFCGGEESMALFETPETKKCEVEDAVAGDVPSTSMEDPTRLSPLFPMSSFANNNASVDEPASEAAVIASLDVTIPYMPPLSNGTSATSNKCMRESFDKPSESLDERIDDGVSSTIDSSQIPQSITQDSTDVVSASSSPSIFQEAIECLAESNLIYLLADLRWLSATGRIFTKYEAINIDSDFVAKDSAASLTASPSATWPVGARKGISPAQTMAVLLVELRKEFNEMIREKNDNKNKVKNPEEENALPTNEKTLFSSMVDPSGRKESTRKLHVSMKAYSDMIGRDLNKKAPEIKVESLLKESLPKNNGKVESLVEESLPKK